MKVRKARDPSVGIEALNLYSMLQSSDLTDSVLGDDQDRTAFINLVERGISESLSDRRRLQGRWTQDLFEAVAVSLDSIRLIKEEDSGSFYFDHTRPILHLPDYRVVLNDNRQILVEVKNVGPSDIKKKQKIRTSQVEATREYARLTGAELYFAHFWASITRWTLVNSSVLDDSGEFKILSLETAIKQNEMMLLGDFYVGTQSLEFALSFVVDPDKPQRVVKETDGTTSVYLTLGSDEIYCEGQLITDDTERRIASAFMMYSGLEMTERVIKNIDGTIRSLDYVFSPIGEGATSHLAPMSGMFSVQYILATKAEDGSITRIRHDPDANLTRLIPDEYWAGPNHTLTMLRLVQHPLGSRDVRENTGG